MHYFASRHGFHAPGDAQRASATRVLTWPEGNGWLDRAAGGAAGRAPAARARASHASPRAATASKSMPGTPRRKRVERWQAERCIVALPLFIAAPRGRRTRRRCCASARATIRYAPWLVANLHLRAPLARPARRARRAGTTSSTARAASAMSMRCTRASTRAPRADGAELVLAARPGEDGDGRQLLLDALLARLAATKPLAELSVPHPDLASQAHAHRHHALRPCHGDPGAGPARQRRRDGAAAAGRLAFAHGDWSGYSIFEEAFTRGHRAGLGVV